MQPLDADLDKALAMALEVAYAAAGTRTALGGAGLPSDVTFQQFRDATMQVAEELASEGTLPSDAPAKIALAWAAVGLPPRGGAPTIAAPANNKTDVVYPWTTFVWPTSRRGRPDRLELGLPDREREHLPTLVAYGLPGITETVTQDGKTMGALPLAVVPYNSSDTFLWRVRPHVDGDPPWEICTPMYSFLGTGEPDPITDLKVTSDVASGTTQLPARCARPQLVGREGRGPLRGDAGDDGPQLCAGLDGHRR